MVELPNRTNSKVKSLQCDLQYPKCPAEKIFIDIDIERSEQETHKKA